MSRSNQVPPADLHTPEELLENAEALLGSENPKMLRGAILEAITALDSFVHRTLFPSLEQKIEPFLVARIEDKTKMDFDCRLSMLVPIATGIPVEKGSELWND